MKKVLLLLGIGMLVFGFTGIAGATLYEEGFLFGTDGDPLTGWYVAKDRRVEIHFDLNQSGNLASYYKQHAGVVLDTRIPGEDAAGFVPGTSLAWAKLNVRLASIDSKKDPVRILATLQDSSNKTVYEHVLDLTNDYTAFETYLPRSVVEQLQNTGGLSALFLTPYWVDYQTYCDNGFILHEAGLSAQVPEPSTLLLLSAGLLGLLGFARFRKA